jgi:hypothetical protein
MYICAILLGPRVIWTVRYSGKTDSRRAYVPLHMSSKIWHVPQFLLATSQPARTIVTCFTLGMHAIRIAAGNRLSWFKSFFSLLMSRYSDWLRAGRQSARSSSPGRVKSSLLHVVQTVSGVHLTSYPMRTRGSLPGVKRQWRENDHSPPASAQGKK